jgi:hypothetical protein
MPEFGTWCDWWKNYGAEFPPAQADNCVTTSCDYLIATGNLDYGDASLSPMAEKLFTRNFASRPLHEPTPAF